jgi:PAS domain S-box-containing protein
LAVGGFLAHAAILALWGSRVPGPLLSDIVEFLLGVLAALATLDAARRSPQFARRVWYFTSAALWIYTAGQGLVIYYDNVAHAALFTPWISDQFLFFWVVPLLLAALLDPLERRALDLALLLDIVQVIIIALALHFAVFASPQRWQVEGSALAFLEWRVKLLRDAVVLGALLMRVVATNFPTVRKLFLRLSVFFLAYAIADGIYLYLEAKWEIRAGTAYDLLWSVPRLLLVVLAVTWQTRDEEEFRFVQPGQMRRRILLHIVPIVGPFLVLGVIATSMSWAPLLSVLLILTSLVCSSLRLLLTQFRQELAIGALRLSESRYRSLFERNRAGVFRSSPAKGIIDCNDAFAQMFGYTREEVLGLSPDALYPGGKTERDARMAGIRQAGEYVDYELCYRRKDGSLIWAIQNVAMTQDENGQEVVEGTVVDITERHNLEEQLRQSQKMEAIGRLAGGVAHDFNNLLTVISGYSQLLEEGLRAEPRMQGEAKQIREAAERAAMLTRQLLAFSRRQVLQPQAISLNSTLTNVEKLLNRMIGEDVELVTRYAPGLWAVRADPGQIEQVAMNLAVNARDAMPRGGKLTFETQNCPLTADELREHPIMPTADYVRLTVADTGSGMDPQTKTQIFEPFFTTKKVGEGTGLGLSTVYGIVKQSGGFVWVDSEVGRGTTFRVYFPRIDVGAESGALAAAGARTALSGKETILLVEDDERVRGFAASVLKSSGYTVLEARDGGEAEAINRRTGGKIDLLLIDVIMPGATGVEVAQRIREQRPGIKVLFMTGYSEDTHPWQGLPRVNGAILQKPFTPRALAAEVRSVLDRVATKP